MSELKTEHLVYMSDDMYIPIYYKNVVVRPPFFQGKGNHSVKELEEICEQFKEYCHQQSIIKQNCMKHIIELKFGVEFPEEDSIEIEWGKMGPEFRRKFIIPVGGRKRWWEFWKKDESKKEIKETMERYKELDLDVWIPENKFD